MKDKPKIYSYWERPQKEASPEGNELEPTFEMIPNDKGVKELVKTGETNIREKIQQFKDDCDIKQLLARATVDPTVLNQREGFYADVTEMPKTLGEAQNMIIKIRNSFDSLPPEERAKFNYSAEQYIAEYGSKEWAEKVGVPQEEAQAITQAIKETEPTKEKGAELNES